MSWHDPAEICAGYPPPKPCTKVAVTRGLCSRCASLKSGDEADDEAAYYERHRKSKQRIYDGIEAVSGSLILPREL